MLLFCVSKRWQTADQCTDVRRQLRVAHGDAKTARGRSDRAVGCLPFATLASDAFKVHAGRREVACPDHNTPHHHQSPSNGDSTARSDSVTRTTDAPRSSPTHHPHAHKPQNTHRHSTQTQCTAQAAATPARTPHTDIIHTSLIGQRPQLEVHLLLCVFVTQATREQ